MIVNPNNGLVQEKQMKNFDVDTALNLEKLKGDDSKAAYHSLIEADHAIVPILVKAYRAESIPKIRAILIEIIGQHRVREAIPFLSEALDDNYPEVWKNALDGFVALGDPTSIQILEMAKQHIQVTDTLSLIKTDWINDAIQQLRNGFVT